MTQTQPRFRRAIAPWAMSALGVLLAGTALCLVLATRAQYTSLALAGVIPGMTLDEAQPPQRGLVITSLRSGSEAQRDGIVVGDRVIAINLHPITSLGEANRLVGDLPRNGPRSGVELEILHNRMRQDIVLHLH